MLQENTIAALATVPAASGIGIVRLSGRDSRAIVESVLRTKSGKPISLPESHKITYGFIHDGEEILDEVLVMTMYAPRSYTGEDSVEIDCHGGVRILERILKLVLKQGARLAEPGEFTKRAFLNGRIDLSEAEAVGDLIHAGSDRAVQLSLSQLRGSVTRKIEKIRAELLERDAFIEAALDDPEHLSLEGFSSALHKTVSRLCRELEDMISTANDGRHIREGIRTVILGKPNAGKSSLLNAMLREDRAIVTDVAGTTRDTLEEEMQLGNLHLHLMDTAGIHETEETVEKIGIDRALKQAEKAELLLFVIDRSRPWEEEDERIFRFLEGRTVIPIANKSDLKEELSVSWIREKMGQEPICLSAKEGEGLTELSEQIQTLFFTEKINASEDIIITNVRHQTLLLEAKEALTEVLRSIENGMPEDFYTIDMMHAYEALGQILGESVSEDLINEIFSKFCMGK